MGQFQNSDVRRQGAKEALARSADQVVVSRGKRVTAFDMAKDAPDDATLMAHPLSAAGYLRAPTIRKGRTLLVGFNEDIYQHYLSE